MLSKQKPFKRICDDLTGKEFYSEELDEELSSYQAELMLEFFMKTLGPPVYNQAISDARAFMLGKLEDLDAEFYEPEEPV